MSHTIDFESILYHLPTGVIVLDPHGHVAFSNAQVHHMVGQSCQGLPWSDCVRDCFQTPSDTGWEIWTATGRRVQIQTQPCPDQHGQMIVIHEISPVRGSPHSPAGSVAAPQVPSPRSQKLELKTKQLIYRDPATAQVLTWAHQVAQTDATVLLCGESGVGKEIFARYIHEHSKRQAGPLVAVNCAAIPETMLEAMLFGYEKGAFTGAHQSTPGKFEQAQHGTLLLDEVTEMPLALQAKLLRVLQEQEVERLGARKTVALDVRIIATSNRDLRQAVQAGVFREDLYYRLQVFQLEIPPLRKRVQDIIPLAEFFLATHARRFGMAVPCLQPAAVRDLLAYPWPGNIRELENVIQRALIVQPHGEIGAADLLWSVTAQETGSSAGSPVYSAGVVGKTATSDSPFAAYPPEMPEHTTLQDNIKQQEYGMILKTLRHHQGSRTQTARTLGISERTLRYKLAKMREEGMV